MDFLLLGPLEVREFGRALPLGGAKQRALLAVLLLHANEVVSRDRLIDELWGENPPETAVASVQVYVSRLRKVLPPETLATQPPGYVLRVEPERIDLLRFERLIEDRRYRDALALWRAPPLADLAEEPFARAEIARLEDLRMAALEERIDTDLADGRHAEVVGELEALVARYPLRERLRAQLMLALYRSGRQAEALKAYQAARRTLVEELGIEPGAELQRLEKAVLVHDPGLGAPAAAQPQSEPAPSVFVGRESELAELLSGLDDAFAGRGRLFLLSGEPGIGKSRLAEELIGQARARGAQVVVGRSWEAGGAPAYWPWVQALRGYVRACDSTELRSQLGPGATDLAQIVPELRERFPDLPEPAWPDSHVARFHLFDATAQFLLNASERRPLVLFLDDLHAADAPSLLLLQFLARELGSARILLFGAYRDVAPTPEPPLIEMLAEVTREPTTRRLTLGRLSERDVGKYVELTASEIASPQLITALDEQAEGNPLFVGEMVRLLCVEGVRSESIAELRLAIPDSVRDVIARRLAHLSEECNRMLVIASVLGRQFRLDALACAADAAEDDVLETLDEAMAAGVVSDPLPGAPGRLRFAHVLIADTLYEGLTAARRIRLHRLTVEALEALYGEDPGPYLTELAHHSIAAGDFDRAIKYACRAGDRALELLGYEESARLYEIALQALDLSGVPDERTRCELLLSLGEANARAGNSVAAKEAFLSAAGVARRLALPCELARAAAGYGGRTVWARAGGDDRLIPLLEEGLTALTDDEGELRARLLARLAGALRDEPSRDRRDRLSSEAVDVARRTGNSAALAYALDGRAAAIVAPDKVAQGLELGGELCEVAGRTGDLERVVSGHMWRIIPKLQLGDIRGAEADLAAASRIAHELRQPSPLWEVYATQGMMALASGRFTQAEELGARAFALGEPAQPEAATPVHRLQRYAFADFRGTLEEVLPAVRDLVVKYPARPAFRCALAQMQARLRRNTDAKRTLDDLAPNDFSVLPFDQEWLYGMSLLAETAALLGDAGSAGVLYGLLVPWAEFNVVDVAEGMRGSVARYLGILATTIERWDASELHFEEALAMNERMGARPWLAHTQLDYARMLLARDAPGDGVHARELLHRAALTYDDLGMGSYAAEASALAKEAARSAAVTPEVEFPAVT